MANNMANMGVYRTSIKNMVILGERETDSSMGFLKKSFVFSTESL
jgi:hypothetical protein